MTPLFHADSERSQHGTRKKHYLLPTARKDYIILSALEHFLDQERVDSFREVRERIVSERHRDLRRALKKALRFELNDTYEIFQ